MNEQQKRAVENANRIAAANYGEYKQGCKEVGRKPITQREYIQRAVAEALASVEVEQPIEAHGVRGMKSTPWRKTFKSADALNRWAEAHDATVHATRIAD